MTYQGKLVALEGIDNAGKTTVLRAVSDRFAQSDRRVVACGELQSPIREAILDLLRTGASAAQKTFLFAADRAWTYEHLLLPALERSEHVLWDRYVDSARAYRAAELKERTDFIDLEFVEKINSAFRPADMTILLDIDADLSIERSDPDRRAQAYDRAYLASVADEYRRLAQTTNYVIVDASRQFDIVANEVARIIDRFLFGGK